MPLVDHACSPWSIIPSCDNWKIDQRAAVISVPHADGRRVDGELSGFRREFYGCLTRRADALFELADAVLCADGPVRSIAESSLVGEHRRGHGSGYAALARGGIDLARLRTALSAVSIPQAAGGRLVSPTVDPPHRLGRP
ncbi:transposase [Saccharothrix coeruleofusca]|uniref:transposase n=1 Tax=Saccharothrix coeruleofusca TaxID=33919 RepID=UPI001E2DD966|nr:transposase [Saccharothrix coeruleofusca]